jgi:hypothetical protein
VTNPEQHRITIEADRLRLIQQRLGSDFYEVPPACEQIAASVLAELKDLEASAPALPH